MTVPVDGIDATREALLAYPTQNGDLAWSPCQHTWFNATWTISSYETNRNHLGDSVEDLIRQHFQDIRKVLLQLGRFDFIASLKKAQFFVKEVDFCGHLLSG